MARLKHFESVARSPSARVEIGMLNRMRQALGHVSTATSDFAAHPLVQLAVLVGCIGWIIVGGTENALASALTIGGFLLTQMILNQQRRRDNALHLKIDELIVAMQGARNEVAGAEHAAEDEINRLRASREMPEE